MPPSNSQLTPSSVWRDRISLGGILVIVGIVLMIVWSF
jgi:hypothetical protein